MVASKPEQFLQSKRQGMRSGKRIVALRKPGKGGNYGIPDFGCCRIDDWALRANYCRLFETARMVIVKSKRRSASGRALAKPTKAHFEAGLFGYSSECQSPSGLGILFCLATAGVAPLYCVTWNEGRQAYASSKILNKEALV
jgi:hypothetical protein